MKTALCLLIGQLPLGLLAESAPAGTATDFLQDHDERVREIVLAHPDSLSSEDRSRVQALINEAFDFRELARLSLGDHWQERTGEERDEFVRIFRGIIERQNFDLFVRYHREGRITYTSEELDEEGRAVVRAEVPLKQETKQIAYFLHQPGPAGGEAPGASTISPWTAPARRRPTAAATPATSAAARTPSSSTPCAGSWTGSKGGAEPGAPGAACASATSA